MTVQNDSWYLQFTHRIKPVKLTHGTTQNVSIADRLILDGSALSLLLPRERNMTLSTCNIRPPLQNIRDSENGAWLFGSGSFINMGSFDTNSSNFSVAFLFRTFSADCLLYVSFSNTSHQYLTVSLHNGTLRIHSAASAFDSILYASSNSTYNSGYWNSILITYENGMMAAIVNGTQILSGNISNTFASTSFQPLDQVGILSLSFLCSYESVTLS